MVDSFILSIATPWWRRGLFRFTGDRCAFNLAPARKTEEQNSLFIYKVGVMYNICTIKVKLYFKVNGGAFVFHVYQENSVIT